MTRKQSNKLKMLNNLYHLLSTTTATSALAALPPKVAALGGKITLIGELADAQTMPTDGVTQERAGSVEQAVRAAQAVAGPLLSYARSHGLAPLASIADVSLRDFRALRLAERPRLAQRIYEAAEPLVAAAAPHGLTPALLETLGAKIAAAVAAAGSVPEIASDKQLATRDLATAFAEAEALLAEIDPMMAPYRESDPGFFARYELARTVVNRPGVRSATEDEAAGTDPATTAGGAATAAAVTSAAVSTAVTPATATPAVQPKAA